MKRKGFMSLEMLLVIGVVVAALAGVFAVYKKIQANNASMQVTQDIATIVNGLDRFKGATGGYPHITTLHAMNDATNAIGAGKWNQEFAYVSQDIASKWQYQTGLEVGSVLDTTTGTGTGYVTISTKTANYAALKSTEIRDILRGKCLNGMKAVSGVPKITNAEDPCVIAANAIVYQQ